MAVSGNLRTMPFADLLQWISLSQKTGTLVIKGRRFTKKILFAGGRVSAVTSNNPREHLGYYLVGWGLLTEDELQALLEMQQSQRVALGGLLTRIGRFSEEEIQPIIRAKTEETIYDLILWEEGEFFFLDDDRPLREIQGLDLPVDHFLFEGARQADERRRIREVIPDVLHIPILAQALDKNSLSPRQQAIAECVDGVLSIEEIALKCRVPAFEVLTFMFSGIRTGVFALQPPAEKARPLPGFVHVSWAEMVREADNCFMLGDLYECYKQILVLREKFPHVPDAVAKADGLEKRIAQQLERTVLATNVILDLAVAPGDLVNLNCAPEEGFILSRINGLYAMQQILAQLPGSKLRNQLVIYGLMQRGIIKVQESRAVSKYQATRQTI